ncbi:MAG: radical SAM-associated putative lipoprotein [Alistipes sp.]|nr:radical SAM-associated putative lipoprotein [Alistipes sp.]
MKRLIYLLMAMLGFGLSSCSEIFSDNPPFNDDDVVAEYGVPHVIFRVSARVVDEAGTPIEGICLVVGQEPAAEYNSSYSDSSGDVSLETWLWPGTQNKVQFVDTDGEANGGEFETLELDITDKITQYEEGEGNWYEGGYQAELGEVTMTLKKDAILNE